MISPLTEIQFEIFISVGTCLSHRIRFVNLAKEIYFGDVKGKINTP